MTTNKYENSYQSVKKAVADSYSIDKILKAYRKLGKEWVRCKELTPKNPATASGVLNRLYKAGLAERRTYTEPVTIEDGFVAACYNKNGERVPASIPVYDKNGNYLCDIGNPQIYDKKWEVGKRIINAEIAEYKISLAD